jgi:DNA-binding response OmpR family regulator
MGIRCLVVDDSRRFLRSVRALLESQGAVVDAAPTARAAEARLSDAAFDVILVDVHLGDESGVEAARRLRSIAGKDQVIILISAANETDFVELVAIAAADAFLPKPRLSVSAIAAVLAQARRPGSNLDS